MIMKLQEMDQNQLEAYGLERFDTGSGKPARLGLWRFSDGSTLFL
jgi:hypothetical protein